MNCEELVAYLSEYLDNELSEELRQDAQEHLVTCRNCRVVLDTTQKTIALYRQTNLRELTAVRRSALYDQVLAAFQKRDLGQAANQEPGDE